MRYVIGWITISGIIFIIIVNILIMSNSVYHNFKLNRAKKLTQKKYEAQMKVVRAQFKESNQEAIEQKRKAMLESISSRQRRGSKSARLPMLTEEKSKFNRFSHSIGLKYQLTPKTHRKPITQLVMTEIKESKEEQSIDEYVRSIGVILPEKIRFQRRKQRSSPEVSEEEKLDF